MRVLIVNTSERTGGAAVAAGRLVQALNNYGVQAKMLVRDKDSDTLTVAPLPRSPLMRWRFLWERFVIYCHLHLKRDHLFEIDISNAGCDITGLREFKEADVIHLHWVNQGMLSLADIRRILHSGKPVVWTMHDAWPATAICHVTLGCRQFTSACHNCRLLPNRGGKNDLSASVWRKKQAVWGEESIYFVACSRWLAQEAKSSALLKGHKVTNIPNPINTHIYQPQDKAAARQALGLPADRRLILFVSQRATNRLKGMDYLVEACQRMADAHPEMRQTTGVVILGGHAEEVVGQLPFESYPLGYVSDEQRIIQVYNAADVYVLPSLSDNLPNTIMEAMACGLPCVGFRVGGIPEMIDHQKNGYVATYRDADDLARGIRWVLDEADGERLSQQALRKVATCYSQQSVASSYIEVYNQALAMKHYRL